ncbi:PDZ domain-containing protein [Enhygromyxa salina]|nr:PDZ domain-containing protein [Enhygromyxa salina]
MTALGLVAGFGLGCGGDVPAPTADPAGPATAPTNDPLLAELLGESVEVDGERVIADAIVVRLAFEPLIRGTGPASLQLVQSQGYRLSGVAERGPLWLLGLRDGDVLTSVDGQPISAREHELRSQWEARPRAVEITYLRGTEVRVLKLEIRAGASWKSADPGVKQVAERNPSELVQATTDRETDATAEPTLDLSEAVRCTPSEADDEDLGRCELDRAALDELLSRPELLARQMRIVPSHSDGQPLGFKVYGIRSSSFPSLLGLRNGDLITAINGHPLNSPDDALTAYSKLREATELVLALRRDGQDRKLTIVIGDGLPG